MIDGEKITETNIIKFVIPIARYPL
jgi:hypothetical protein